MYLGMLYISGSHYSYMQKESIKWIFFSIILGSNLFYLIYWTFLVYKEFIKYVFEKNKIAFRILTCGKFKINDFQKKYINN
jgi:hypothetical protein